MEPRSQRRAAIALVASLALHLALLGFWVWRTPRDIHGPARALTVDLEIRETRRSPPPAALPRPPPAPALPAAPAMRRPSSPAHDAHHPAPSAAPSPPAPSLAPAPSPAEVAADAEWGTISVPQAVAPAKPIDLGAAGTRSAGKVAEAQIGTEPELPAPPDRSIHAPSQDPNINRRVASLIDRDRGRRNVERGLVDPYFSELSKALTSNWQLPKEVEHPMSQGVLRGIGANFMEGLSGWQEAAAEWGRTGTSPIGRRMEDGRDEAQAAGDGQAMAEAMNHRGALVVRLTQSRAGRLLDVELVAASGNPAVDAAVISGLRAGQTVLPVPPTEGMGIKDPIRSLWAFELSIKVCPPAPILSGNFDLAAPFDPKIGNGASVCIPLDRTIEKHVELLEVD